MQGDHNLSPIVVDEQSRSCQRCTGRDGDCVYDDRDVPAVREAKRLPLVLHQVGPDAVGVDGGQEWPVGDVAHVLI